MNFTTFFPVSTTVFSVFCALVLILFPRVFVASLIFSASAKTSAVFAPLIQIFATFKPEIPALETAPPIPVIHSASEIPPMTVKTPEIPACFNSQFFKYFQVSCASIIVPETGASLSPKSTAIIVQFLVSP